MIDGFKAILKINLERIRSNPLLDFQMPVSVSTGEVQQNKRRTAIYKGIKIQDYGSLIEFSGSLHKFYNNGYHNYDDLPTDHLQAAIASFCDEMMVNPDDLILSNLEVGVNLILNCSPSKIINAIINHRGEKFSYKTGNNIEFKECKHTQFYIKVYDKGLQYALDKNILRCEIKFCKMEVPNKRGIKVLSDLRKIENLHKLKEELIRISSQILIGNIEIKPEGLHQKDELLFAQGHNPDFWDSIMPKTINYLNGNNSPEYKNEYRKYERKMRRFKWLLSQTGANSLKEQLMKKLVLKSNQLLSRVPPPILIDQSVFEKRGKLTGVNNHYGEREFIQLKEKTWEIDQVHKNVHSGSEEVAENSKSWETDPLLYSVRNEHLKRRKSTCQVTGLDISMQKPCSIFLCSSGIRFYFKNNPNIKSELMKRLSPKWNNSDEKIQIREIHHSIRNEYFNRIYNNRKSVRNLFRMPVLFDQMSLVRPEKLQIAGII